MPEQQQLRDLQHVGSITMPVLLHAFPIKSHAGRNLASIYQSPQGEIAKQQHLQQQRIQNGTASELEYLREIRLWRIFASTFTCYKNRDVKSIACCVVTLQKYHKSYLCYDMVSITSYLLYIVPVVQE